MYTTEETDPQITRTLSAFMQSQQHQNAFGAKRKIERPVNTGSPEQTRAHFISHRSFFWGDDHD